MDCCTAQKDFTTQLIEWALAKLCRFIQVARTLVYSAYNCQSSEAAARENANQQAARILDEHGNRILRLAYSYLHNMSDAEDILQDTLIQFLKTAPKFENAEHEKAWLLRVASNLSKNKIAYNSMRKTDELSETLAAEQREDLLFVWEAVKSLPKQYQEAIHLFYYEGYSTAEIASIIKMKESTVRSNLRRGRTKLKKILKEAYDFEETVR